MSDQQSRLARYAQAPLQNVDQRKTNFEFSQASFIVASGVVNLGVVHLASLNARLLIE